MAENTINGKVAIVGIGESDYYKRGQSPLRRVPPVSSGHHGRRRGRRNRSSRDRRLRLLCERPQRPNPYIHRAGVPQGGLQHHVLGRRRRRRFGSRRQRSGCPRRRGTPKYVVAYRGLAQGQFGRFGQALAARQSRVMGPTPPTKLLLGACPPGKRWRPCRPQRHMHDYGTTQDQLGAIAHGVLQARADEPPRCHVRQAIDDGGVPRLPLDRPTSPSVRLLPGD